MAVFKCKMCGGAMKIDGQAYGTCPYCGTQQTFPKLDDERRAQMYDRANEFRRLNEFDKALGIYEQILSEEPTDAEAYWSVVLCTYGVEYVEDPTTHKRIPTVNRAQYTSIYADKNYLSALANADSNQKILYENEAKKIDEIQKGILEVSSKEEPYDIFICYKETDDAGNRTQDSVYAYDIYDALTKEGYRVFFSRITLENKLGTAYEPYIFAALNSAKVMIVVGTSKENFNAVWVKNEWARFISLMKTDKSKTLIPVYKDIAPIDLPGEFAYLQAQDMSKIGFMQDIVHGVDKLIKKETTTVKETVVVNNTGNFNYDALLKRAYMSLEDGDWSAANNFCEQILNVNPECADAYLVKLMAELHVKRQRDLNDLDSPFDSNNNYQKAIRFGDSKLISELNDYNDAIRSRNEENRLLSVYTDACNKMNTAQDENDYISVANLFSSIRDYKDSASLIEECKVKAEQERTRKEKELIEKERIDEENRINRERKIKEAKNKITKIFVIVAAIALVVTIVTVLITKVIIPNKKYATEMEIIKSSSKGDTVSFGKYEWIILEKKNGKALLITKDCIDKRAYNDEKENVTWETCSLRLWLNKDFIKDVFSLKERLLIDGTDITTEDGYTHNNNFYDTTYYSASGGKDTRDKVFLLSVKEVKKYYPNDDVSMYYDGKAVNMWLRSPGEVQSFAAYVNKNGWVNESGDSVNEYYGIRPAMWIEVGE